MKREEKKRKIPFWDSMISNKCSVYMPHPNLPSLNTAAVEKYSILELHFCFFVCI